MAANRMASTLSSSATTPVAPQNSTIIVRLYLPPPEHALVLSRDEKLQIQALDRSQPGQTMTHD